MADKRKRQRRGPRTADVDIAPLIDVVFLLIIFFMSIWQAAYIEVEAQLDLPINPQGNPEKSRDPDHFVVNVDRNGNYVVSGRIVSGEELASLIHAQADRARNKEGLSARPIVIRAHAQERFGLVQDILMMCRDAKALKVSLRTQLPREIPGGVSP